MGGHHAERASDVPVLAAARRALLVTLALLALATVVGLFAFWPQSGPSTVRGSAAFTAPGVTFPHAEVVSVQPACEAPGSSGDPGAAPADAGDCGQLVVRLDSSSEAGKRVHVPVAPEVSRAGLRPGDSVELLRTPAQGEAPASYGFFSVDRSTPLWILAAVFVLVVALVAGIRGLRALVGLGFGGLVVVKFMLPALLTGESGLGVALVASSAIMFVVLYLAHGVSLRTSVALVGTLAGVGITAAISVVVVSTARLTGVTDESGGMLSSFVGDISFQGLLTCAVIVAGLGVLNDVTITQTSAVWELRAAAPDLSARKLFTSAMRIGRDHIASTIYTIVFAYSGAALTVLMLLFLYDRPVLELLSTEDIAEEITRTLASAIGLVLAVPATTLLAVALVSPGRVGRRRG